jgi:hypothetical protein
MTTEELTVKVLALEKAVAELRNDRGSPARNANMMAARGAVRDFPEFADVIAFGRYFRVTGQLPPDDWNPGDPIPSPTEEST